jgi:hypothetical protein
MYIVEWSQVALSRLTELLTTLSPADWTKVSGAVEMLDTRLQNDPLQVGESRDKTERIAFVGPLIVSFDVHHADRHVTVLAVAWHNPKKL